MPKTTELRPLDEDEDPSSIAEPCVSRHLGATAKEDKKTKKRKYAGSPDTEVKKKRVVIRVRRRNKKSTKDWVPDPDSLFQLKDYPEDDDLEFITHESTINEGEQATTGKDGQEVDPSLARELEGDSEAMTS